MAHRGRADALSEVNGEFRCFMKIKELTAIVCIRFSGYEAIGRGMANVEIQKYLKFTRNAVNSL